MLRFEGCSSRTRKVWARWGVLGASGASGARWESQRKVFEDSWACSWAVLHLRAVLGPLSLTFRFSISFH